MIFYFSGTGNSYYAAKKIAEENKEPLISIASCMLDKEQTQYEFDLRRDEKIGFVFPIHAWGPTEMVLDFISKLKLNSYDGHYVFAAMTCGGSVGNSLKVLERSLKSIGLPLHSAFSIIMPNSYMLMGDVDNEETMTRKLEDAQNTLKVINNAIKNKAMDLFDVTKGAFPWFLTTVINPMSQKNGINPTKFYATEECINCGICTRVCNSNNIEMKDKPHWGNHCTQCLACINFCPVRAIQYGKATQQKGRYVNPNISVEEVYLR